MYKKISQLNFRIHSYDNRHPPNFVYFNRHNKIYLVAVLQNMATRTERTTKVIDEREREHYIYKHIKDINNFRG